MRFLRSKLFAAAALPAILLCASSALAQRPAGPSNITPGPETRANVFCCVECGKGFGSCNGCTEYFEGHKCSKTQITADCSILSDKVSCSPKETSKPGPSPSQHLVFRLTPSGAAKPESFDFEVRAGTIVGLTRQDGTGKTTPMKPRNQLPVPGPNGCPVGMAMSCWEDEGKAMSICVCTERSLSLKGQPMTLIN
ncbi:MAG TPA: hypothetical protein VN643_05475 [Pyrinomonadaceae bacterium]|nr:hypothetical protein [Pyrinomonadaceae bacterium]